MYLIDLHLVHLVIQTVENTVLSVRLQTFAHELLGSYSGEILEIFWLQLSVCAVTDTESSNNPLLSPPKSLPV